MVEGVGVVVVRGVGSVQALKPLFLFLYEVGVGARASGGYPGQPAVGPWRIPGWDWRGRRWSWGWGGDQSWDLSWDWDGSRSWSRSRTCYSARTGAVGAVVGVVGGGVVVLLMMMLVVVAVVEGDRGGRLGRSLVLAVVMVVILSRNRCWCVLSWWWWWWGRRRDRRLGRRSRSRRSNRLPVQTQVLVLLAEPVQLDL